MHPRDSGYRREIYVGVFNESFSCFLKIINIQEIMDCMHPKPREIPGATIL